MGLLPIGKKLHVKGGLISECFGVFPSSKNMRNHYSDIWSLSFRNGKLVIISDFTHYKKIGPLLEQVRTNLRFFVFRFVFSTFYVTKTNALSFYRYQNVLGWSKFFVPEQKFIYILWQSQTFCARQKDDLHSVKLVFVPAQKFLKRH